MLININSVQENQTLAKAVMHNNSVLLGKGIKIEKKHIDVLHRFGIKNIEVTDNDVVDYNDLSEDIKTKAKEYIFEKTNWEPESDFEKTIYQMAIEQAAINLMKNNSEGR